MSSSKSFRLGSPLLVGVVLFALCATSARARDDGIAVDDCGGCHGGGREASLTVTPSTTEVGLGETVRLVVSVQTTAVAGLYLRTEPALGRLSLPAGDGTKLLGGGVAHSAPKRAVGGTATFTVDWQAPTSPGDVQFLVSAIAGSGDGRSSGDASASAQLSLVFGCTGTKYYADFDQDGHGSPDQTRLACSRPASFAPEAGDCDDYDPDVYPGAPERCNARDDDCDAQIDEELPIRPYCPDADGDGHGVSSGARMMGCGPSKGYGLCDQDCDDSDPTVYPGAPEVCNYRDDDCDQRVDDGARAECGVGWCRRYSEGCNASLCVPGKPVRETCNALDDDCDGMTDEDADLCATGEACMEGQCVRADEVPRDAGATPAPLADAGVDASVTMRDGGDSALAEPSATSDGAGCALAGDASPSARLVGTWLLVAGLLSLARRRRRPSA